MQRTRGRHVHASHVPSPFVCSRVCPPPGSDSTNFAHRTSVARRSSGSSFIPRTKQNKPNSDPSLMSHCAFQLECSCSCLKDTQKEAEGF
jgi:hypothetical protein